MDQNAKVLMASLYVKSTGPSDFGLLASDGSALGGDGASSSLRPRDW
eukprot:CAMPEP_0172921166 /NCGR_PEP_ID=MMETSP1075-20121228/205386_1 /TAXON_ID=2916 /ORGANISM="Ceratium fusus, Strain PA161109" /LENGTH=46 /DNA_ID= /DNA_START= /DNA_END= /DNA_ORIENTATION=